MRKGSRRGGAPALKGLLLRAEHPLRLCRQAGKTREKEQLDHRPGAGAPGELPRSEAGAGVAAALGRAAGPESPMCTASPGNPARASSSSSSVPGRLLSTPLRHASGMLLPGSPRRLGAPGGRRGYLDRPAPCSWREGSALQQVAVRQSPSTAPARGCSESFVPALEERTPAGAQCVGWGHAGQLGCPERGEPAAHPHSPEEGGTAGHGGRGKSAPGLTCQACSRSVVSRDAAGGPSFRIASHAKPQSKEQPECAGPGFSCPSHLE